MPLVAAVKRYKYVFGTASYDALNRLKSADFSSWSGSAWTATLAHDLAGIGYDLAGNLTGLQRYRETGTLIDNLTYTNSTTSNRLNSVTDAVGATTETWDAETGAFTYDANGNLKTAPAPYSVTAVTYDNQNLPVALTSNGITAAYRYNEAGQRITKQVGTGNTEVYLLDGATSLGVFTANGAGTPVSWYFNVLAGDRVVGRHTDAGTRTYYHTDLLGSTRAVTLSTTGAVVESYDFDPWGLLMPGRTLGSGTKEGFTGKEQDAETGLDYFGARYYMPALGRWASVDPSADHLPEWTPYNYVLGNPVGDIDPDGRIPWIKLAKLAVQAVRGGVNTATLVETVRDDIGYARTVFSSDATLWERVKAGGALALDVVSPVGIGDVRAGVKFVTRHADDANDARRAATRVPNPNGKKGGPEHQAKIEEVEDHVRSRGLEPRREHRVETPEGAKGSRFVDVVGKDAQGNVVEMHQVGKQTKGGIPVSRERQAQSDIERATGTRPQFHPYN